MDIYTRPPIGDDGLAFFNGFILVVVITTAIVLVAWLVDRAQKRSDGAEIVNQDVNFEGERADEFFKKIEDFRNDF